MFVGEMGRAALNFLLAKQPPGVERRRLSESEDDEKERVEAMILDAMDLVGFDGVGMIVDLFAGAAVEMELLLDCLVAGELQVVEKSKNLKDLLVNKAIGHESKAKVIIGDGGGEQALELVGEITFLVVRHPPVIVPVEELMMPRRLYLASEHILGVLRQYLEKVVEGGGGVITTACKQEFDLVIEVVDNEYFDILKYSEREVGFDADVFKATIGGIRQEVVAAPDSYWMVFRKRD